MKTSMHNARREAVAEAAHDLYMRTGREVLREHRRLSIAVENAEHNMRHEAAKLAGGVVSDSTDYTGAKTEWVDAWNERREFLRRFDV